MHGQINAGRENRVHETSSIADTKEARTDEAAIVIGEISSCLDCIDEPGPLHAIANDAAGLDNTREHLSRRLAGLSEFRLVHHATDAGFSLRNGNEPEPFVFKANDYGIAGWRALIKDNVFEMAKDSEFFQFRMDNAQALLVTGEISATAGIHQE